MTKPPRPSRQQQAEWDREDRMREAFERPDETQFAIRLIGDERQQQIVEKIDAHLQRWNGYDLYSDDTRAEEALAAVEDFAGKVMDDLRKDLS